MATPAQQLVTAVLENGESAKEWLRRQKFGRHRYLPVNICISRGTANPDHLLRRFLTALKNVDPAKYEEFLAGYNRANLSNLRHLDLVNVKHGDILVDRLSDILQEYCPPFTYFGSLEGNTTEYGCWVDSRRLSYAIDNSVVDGFPTGTTIEDATNDPELPATARYIAIGNRRTDFALYTRTGRFLWKT